MDTHVGNALKPVTSGRVHRSQTRRDVQSGEEVFLHIADTIFHPPLFIGAAHIAGPGFEAIVGGKVQIAGVEGHLLTHGMTQHAGLEVVDENRAWDATKILQPIAMTGQEVLHGFPAGELHIGHA